MRRTATRRLGALGAWIVEDAERLRQRLRLSNAEHERLAAMATDWWRVSPGDGRGAARALLYRLGPEHFTARALLAWSRARCRRGRCGVARSRDAAATLDRAGVSAARRGFSRARRSKRAPRSARRSAGRGSLDRGRVSDGSASARRDRRCGALALCLAHDLFRKPVSSPDQVGARPFRDHALFRRLHAGDLGRACLHRGREQRRRPGSRPVPPRGVNALPRPRSSVQISASPTIA